jgi:prevent-host-death family protein
MLQEAAMKFASIRDLRNRPGELQRVLDEDAVTLTSNGKPFALVVGLNEGEDPSDLDRAIRQARAQLAASRIRARWRTEGAPPSDKEIEQEIAAVRAARKR